MTIANPIYDIVFKNLMEDMDIAKGILSTILNVEIAELTVQPQETTAETDEAMRRKMNIEDEIDREYQEYLSIIEQKNQELEQKDQELAEKKRKIASLKKLLENKK